MGIDYSAATAFGFMITDSMLDEVFRTDIPEISHQEERFDPLTGESQGLVKVIDQKAGHTLSYKEEIYYESQELVEVICQELAATYWCHGGFDDKPDFVIGLEPPDAEDDGLDAGRVSSGRSYPVEAVKSVLPRLNKIGDKLRKMGLRIRKPRVYSTMFVF